MLKVDKCEINSSIECRLNSTKIGNEKYALVHILKNDTLLAKQAIKTDDLIWPVIAIGSSQTTIEFDPNLQMNRSLDKSGILSA